MQDKISVLVVEDKKIIIHLNDDESRKRARAIAVDIADMLNSYGVNTKVLTLEPSSESSDDI